jgi:hypothetical protein
MSVWQKIAYWYWWDLKIPYKFKFYNTGNGKWVIYLGGLCTEHKSLRAGTIELIKRQLKMYKLDH